MNRLALVATALVVFAHGGLVVHADDLEVHVIDTGGALCTVTKVPSGEVMVFDAGKGIGVEEKNVCLNGIKELLPSGSTIDLLILSHSDADHISDVAALVREYKTKRVIRTGFARDTWAWCSADYAIKVHVDGADAYSRTEYYERIERCSDTGRPVWVKYSGDWPPPKSKDFNLKYYRLEPGEQIQLGDATVTLLHGLNESDPDWDDDFPQSPRKRESRRRNAVSIVARLDYEGRSVLFTGDAVGHHGNSNVYGSCIATDLALITGHDADEALSIKSDVLIAPHHGSSNGSCLGFIRRVKPEFVIFTAGHAHGHPAYQTVRRYFQAGISSRRLYRTDRGDGERWSEGEWRGESCQRQTCWDGVRDDDILIVLPEDGGAARITYK